MSLTWNYQNIKAVLNSGLRGFFPEECTILDERFFLDVAIPKKETDEVHGTMSEFEKAINAILCLCIQESYRVTGDGPVRAQHNDSFFLVEPKLFQKRSRLSILSMMFSGFLQTSLSRLNERKERIHLTSREGFQLITELEFACIPIEAPMRKVPTSKSVGEIFIENILGEVDLQKAAEHENGFEALPKDAVTLGRLNEFEIVAFQTFTTLFQETLNKKTTFHSKGLDQKEFQRLERMATIANILNQLFARSVFKRFPELNEGEFMIGKDFMIAPDTEPQNGLQFMLVPFTDAEEDPFTAEMLTTGESLNHTAPVDKEFDLESWDPGKKSES